MDSPLVQQVLVLLTQVLLFHFLQRLQQVIYNHWNRVLVLEVALNFLLIFQLEERSHNFLNSLLDQDLLEGFFPSENNANDVKGFLGVFKVFFVGLELNLVDFIVFFGELIIVERDDVGQGDVTGVINVDLNALFFGGSELE